jgi:phage recombination protein Bet
VTVATVDKATGEMLPQQAGALSGNQVQLIKDTIAREQNLTHDELRLFLYAAERHGLDPLARQIYAVKRGGKMTIQTGIDGYRAIAARTGQYAGSDDAVFEEGEAFPRLARVTVYRFVQGQRCAFTATAYWAEYYPGDSAAGTMWRKMPHTMLAKVAEALALRKGFPAELSGLYTTDEMDQAREPVDTPAVRRTGVPAVASGGYDGPVMPFGRSKGTLLVDVSTDHLARARAWAADKGKFPSFVTAADAELARRVAPAAVSFEEVPPALATDDDALPF